MLFLVLSIQLCYAIGLGLALVNEMVSANDCEIGVASEVGKGATFTLYIPSDRVIGKSQSAS